MNRNVTTQMDKVNVSGLANVSPKTMAAAVLMCTMLILWGRVLLGGKQGPQSAQAAEAAAAEQTAQAGGAASMELKPVGLRCLPGRNDALTADLFSSERWTASDFHTRGKKNPVEVADDGQQEEKNALADLDALSKELLLDAVIQGADGRGMQAFVGDKVLTAGQTLTVKRQSRVYELNVAEVTSEEVVLTWKAYSIRLKITESHE